MLLRFKVNVQYSYSIRREMKHSCWKLQCPPMYQIGAKEEWCSWSYTVTQMTTCMYSSLWRKISLKYHELRGRRLTVGLLEMVNASISQKRFLLADVVLINLSGWFINRKQNAREFYTSRSSLNPSSLYKISNICCLIMVEMRGGWRRWKEA